MKSFSILSELNIFGKTGLCKCSNPSHSPDITSFDFFSFPKMKLHPKSKRFEDIKRKNDSTDSCHIKKGGSDVLDVIIIYSLNSSASCRM